MEPKSIPLTLPARNLIRLAHRIAGELPPDERHLLIAFLTKHAMMAERLASDLDVEALQEAAQKELEESPASLVTLEDVIRNAWEITLAEELQIVDVRHIGMALLLGRGIEVQPSSAPPSQAAALLPRPSLLEQVGINVTRQATHLPSVVARDHEIDSLIETLCRPLNPYAVLVGIEGTGRRAVVQGLAQRVAANQVPEPLKGRPVYVLPQIVDDPRFYLGLIEQSVKENAILYLEPFELFISTTQNPQLDLARLHLLSELVSRRVPVIGAVSSTEQFRKQVGRAPDLLKRFQPIPVQPLSADESLQVVRQLATHLEEMQHLQFPEETLQQLIGIADEYIQHRPFPDKAILLMDQAAGRASMLGQNVVEPRTVWEVANLVTGLPIGAGEASMLKHLEGLEAYLKQRVIGQEDATSLLAKVFTLKIRRLDLRPSRPNGVFLFVGPTGVGKTETARALSEYLFGSSQKMLRLDMNQYYSSHTLARLLGAEFGYVGFDQGSPLLDFVAENPFSVVLLDEVEKADPEVHKFFLQLFDEGYIIDAQGRRVSFSDTVIIMTSNLKPEKVMGFLKGVPTLEDWKDTFQEQFSPEFINRIDAICIFEPLSQENIDLLVRERVYSRLQEIYRKRGVELTLTDAALRWLADRGYSEEYGARELERVIEREMLLLVAPYVPLQLEQQAPRAITLDVSGVGDEAKLSAQVS